MNKHFVLYENTEYWQDYCGTQDGGMTTYYIFEDVGAYTYSGGIYDILLIPIEIYEYLGYYIPEHLDDYNERVDYVETMLSTLDVTWEIKQEG